MRLLEPFIWIAWDLLAALILFYSVSKCARQGFATTIVRLLIYVAAAAAAHMLYKNFALFIYDNVVHDAVQHILIRSFNEMLNRTGDSANDIIHAIPFALRMMLGFKRGEIKEMPLDSADVMAAEVLDKALEAPLVTMLHTVSFMFIFMLAAFIVRRIARLLTGINKIPVIGTLNVILGGIAGIVEGLLTLFVMGFVLRLLVSFSGEEWWWLNTEVMKSTYIWSLFY